MSYLRQYILIFNFEVVSLLIIAELFCHQRNQLSRGESTSGAAYRNPMEGQQGSNEETNRGL